MSAQVRASGTAPIRTASSWLDRLSGWTRRQRPPVLRPLVPPRPRLELDRRPRVGDHGPALLALADGTVFPGIAFGAPLAAGGDLVVNTSQTGYQEVCTDPSYAGQVVVMTYPLIGNHGRCAPTTSPSGRGCGPSSWPTRRPPCSTTPASWRRCCASRGIPAIAGIDTRALARHLRTHGSIPGLVTSPGEVEPATAIAAVRALPRWEDEDFVGLVSPTEVDRRR